MIDLDETAMLVHLDNGRGKAVCGITGEVQVVRHGFLEEEHACTGCIEVQRGNAVKESASAYIAEEFPQG